MEKRTHIPSEEPLTMTLLWSVKGSEKRSPTVNSSSGSWGWTLRRIGKWGESLPSGLCGLACTYRNFMHRPQTSDLPLPLPPIHTPASPRPWPQWAHLSSDPWSASQLLRLHFFALPPLDSEIVSSKIDRLLADVPRCLLAQWDRINNKS